MSDWREQPATNNQLGTILHLLELHRPQSIQMPSIDDLVTARDRYKADPTSMQRIVLESTINCYLELPRELYDLAISRIKDQIRDSQSVFLTKGKASDIMGEIRNGYTVDKFRELFL